MKKKKKGIVLLYIQPIAGMDRLGKTWPCYRGPVLQAPAHLWPYVRRYGPGAYVSQEPQGLFPPPLPPPPPPGRPDKDGG